MKEMMGKYLGVDINYTTVLNFQAFRDAINAVGGVDVTVDKNMCYRDTADNTDINLKAGDQHLDGKEALDFVRYRKSNCKPKTDESNDFDRNKRQSQVMNAMLDQMKSLGGITKIGKVISAVDKNMTTDVESEQMKNFIATYWNISTADVHFTPVTGSGEALMYILMRPNWPMPSRRCKIRFQVKSRRHHRKNSVHFGDWKHG